MSEEESKCGCGQAPERLAPRVMRIGALEFNVDECARCDKRIFSGRVCTQAERGLPCPIDGTLKTGTH